MEDPTGLTETADPPEIPPLVEEGTGSIPWEVSYTDGLAPGVISAGGQQRPAGLQRTASGWM